MPEFLTVKEAAALVGKSSSSIRRIIYPILENDAHPDRGQIWPSPEEATALRLKGENFPWKLTRELLDRTVPPEAAAPKSETTGRSGPASPDGELVAMLRGELSIKNQQITEMAELMKGLSERLREGNILMGTLQKQLQLSEGRERKDDGASNAVEAVVTKPTPKAKPVKSDKPQKGDKSEKGSAKSEKKNGGFWSWLRS